MITCSVMSVTVKDSRSHRPCQAHHQIHLKLYVPAGFIGQRLIKTPEYLLRIIPPGRLSWRAHSDKYPERAGGLSSFHQTGKAGEEGLTVISSEGDSRRWESVWSLISLDPVTGNIAVAHDQCIGIRGPVMLHQLVP